MVTATVAYMQTDLYKESSKNLADAIAYGLYDTKNRVGSFIANANSSSRKHNKSSTSVALPKNGASSAAAGSPVPNNNNNDEPNFKDSNETAKKFNTNTKNYERNLKKQIIKDSREEAKTNKQLQKFLDNNDNPDVGTDKNGNIWLKSRTSNATVKTPLKVNMYD